MLNIKSTEIAIIETIIGIQFIPAESGEGRVCAVRDFDLRPEFQDSFSTKHLLAYILAHIDFDKDNEEKISEIIEIPYPSDAVYFWKSISKINLNDLNSFDENGIEVIFINSIIEI
ncbi:hypothetical protein EV144_105314 [Flavobacterium sp. 270]|uniref:hypothetical protein n=1 Tax=Flavobacterium sp. 270 TaxID=2512114 RepID=UPI0010666D8B|nr:hypothetical protein [Flavobacterium sp. 270]TDW47295.1 hypothetical protein EV144_105314 [Flavobacterium sp. 270]